MLQNPRNVQVKEELARLRKRLKAAERELQEKRTQAEQRADKIQRLKDDLEKITAGALRPSVCVSLCILVPVLCHACHLGPGQRD